MTPGEKQQRDFVDKTLMRRLQEGDDIALNELMAHWKEPLVAFLYRFTGNWSTAVELAQDTFVRVYQSRDRYRPRGSFSNWIFTIASNLAKNESRWRNRHPGSAFSREASTEQGDDFSKMASGDMEPDAAILQEEKRQQVKAAIAQLPNHLRTVVVLFEYHHMSYSEIAEIESCSPKAVETRLYRARALLREALRDVDQ